MDTTVLGVLSLIKSAITGQPVTFPAGFRATDCIRLMQQQGIVSLGYIGALNKGIPENNPLMLQILDQYCLDVVNSERQLNQISRICAAFEENGIDYMPVKGTILKHLYPMSELRRMSDADILIREEQYPQIVPIMQSLEFTESGESDHEHIWRHTFLKVELHKRLIPSYNSDFYSYFGTGWDLARIQNGHRFSMTEEDAFIYNFIHFAKHYRDGDVNCRFVIDLWVHMRHCPELDMEYIRRQMEKMRMEKFYDNIMHLIACWFEDSPSNEQIERITQVLFNVDAQERKQLHSIAQNARIAQEVGADKNWKSHSILQKIFPNREHMDWSYPKWKKVPLVIAWFLRWMELLFCRRDVVKNRLEEAGQVSQKEVENYRQDLEYVGLQFSDNVALPD